MKDIQISQLEERLFHAIEENVYSFSEETVMGIRTAARSCYKLCLQEQIDLLKKVGVMYLLSNARDFERQADELQNELIEKLKALK